MASSKERQRKLARAKHDRQMARRAAAARRKRQVMAGTGAGLTVLLIAVLGVWLFGGFDSKPKNQAGAEEQCAWTPQNGDKFKDVGTPPTKDIPTEGTRPMTITTNAGAIQVGIDVTSSPCAAASFTYLSGKKFFDTTKCHELTTEGALRCGDPDASGLGGPTYSYFGENVPSAPEPTPTPTPSTPATKAPPLYPRGTVALVSPTPGANGSQFLIFFKDFTTAEPGYSILGKVTSGLDVLDKIVKAGTVANGAGEKVKPKNDVVIQSLTVGEIAPTPTPTPQS